ncbi:MAG: hypothetical protein J6I76_21975 [Oribacterium sp.]|nr:hypothetical protein [Oribacterium sp.]
MTETNVTTTNNVMMLIERMMNSKHAPLYAALATVIGIFGIYEYFDKVDKGMELGYETSAKAGQFGEVSFLRKENNTYVENEQKEAKTGTAEDSETKES